MRAVQARRGMRCAAFGRSAGLGAGRWERPATAAAQRVARQRLDATHVARARRGASNAEVSTSAQQQVGTPAEASLVASKGMLSAPLVSQLVFSVSVIACSLSVATAALIFSFIPAVKSLKQAAEEMALLARVLREETPDTMAALRLSGVEISDCVEEIGELSTDLTRGIRTSARTIAATSGAVREGAHYVKDNVYPAVKEKVVPVATSTVKTVLRKRADMSNYDRPVVAMAASRTAKVVKGLRALLLAKDAYQVVGGGGERAAGSLVEDVEDQEKEAQT